MKIGVVSDTHSRGLPPQLLKDFKTVDLIIHAGDFCSVQDLKLLSQLKKVEAVQGNMDEAAIRKLFPRKQILKLDQYTIGLFHGEGPAHIVPENVKAEFSQDNVDCVIFGHSHIPFNEQIGKTLYFNPGSPNDTITAPYCSYGILELAPTGILARIIKVDD